MKYGHGVGGEMLKYSLKQRAQTPNQQVGVITEKNSDLKNFQFQSLGHLCFKLALRKETST